MATLFAKVMGQTADGKLRVTRVNPECVHLVAKGDKGTTIIAYQHVFNDATKTTTSVSINSVETIEKVMKRLNRPYIIDVSIRLTGLIVSALAIAVAIWLSSDGNPS